MCSFFPNPKGTAKNNILKIIRIIFLMPYIFLIYILITTPILYSHDPAKILDFGRWATGPIIIYILIFIGGRDVYLYLYGVWTPNFPMWPICFMAAIGIMEISLAIRKKGRCPIISVICLRNIFGSTLKNK